MEEYEQQSSPQQPQEQAETQSGDKDEEKAFEQEKSKKKKSQKKHSKEKKNRKVGRWYLGETLGKGVLSWVKKGYDRENGFAVALKFASKAKLNINIDWSDNAVTKPITDEIESLRQIKHKNVEQILAYNITRGKYPQKDGTIIPTVLLVLEYLSGGELFGILYYTHELKEDIARTYFNQLINGLTAYHSAGICHTDIKPQNLLLNADFRLKIAHFGVDKVFDKIKINKNINDESSKPNPMRTFYVGTRCYHAPEIINQKDYSFECDIFSCGVILFILLAGYPPFEVATSKCRWYAPLAAGNARQFWKQHRGCGIPSLAKDLITRMLWYDKTRRITINGIKKHKWYNAEQLSQKQLKKELTMLHRKMETERRKDALKYAQLHDYSICRCIGCCHAFSDIKSAVIIDNGKKLSHFDDHDIESLNLNKDKNKDEEKDKDKEKDIDNDNDNDNDTTSDEKTQELQSVLQNGMKTFRNGDTISNCSNIVRAAIKSNKAHAVTECTNIIIQKFLNVEKKELYCHNIVATLIELYTCTYQNHCEPEWGQIKEAGDATIVIDYSETTDDKPIVAPPLPKADIIKFRDVFTQRKPKIALHHIQKVIINLGGEATVDLDNCSIDAKLATHNFPTPVMIGIHMYFCEEYNAYVVRFDRISGDVLHFAKILRKLVPDCGYALTGMSHERYNTTQDDNDQDSLSEFNTDGKF